MHWMLALPTRWRHPQMMKVTMTQKGRRLKERPSSREQVACQEMQTKATTYRMHRSSSSSKWHARTATPAPRRADLPHRTHHILLRISLLKLIPIWQKLFACLCWIVLEQPCYFIFLTSCTICDRKTSPRSFNPLFFLSK